MQWRSLLAFVAVIPNVYGLIRFPCSQLVVERFDPLVNPGEVSPHLHQIIGGNAFNITMNPDNDLASLSTCTTCRFKEDFSNYWTAVLYFKHPNGTYKRVPQMANQAVGSPSGGMTIYYIQGSASTKNTAFQKGFRMLVGDAMTRSMNSTSPEYTSLSFRCFGANFGGNTSPPGGGTDTFEFPSKFCAGGIRTNIFFPTCWDGKNLDSPDHKSHVTYPSGTFTRGNQLGFVGKCPSTHPVRIPQILYETVWDTRGFKDIWPTDGSQPLVYSMGDPTGYGQHADYVFGWKEDSLQRAMDKCNDGFGTPESCKELTVQPDSAINACSQKSRVAEQVDGWLTALPGCNPVQAGPGRAVTHAGCGEPTTYLP